MTTFKGFPANEDSSIPVPAAFFSDLLPAIDELDELRITLYVIWNLSGQPAEPRKLLFSEIIKDDRLVTCFGKSTEDQLVHIKDGLKRACQRGSLLEVLVGEDTCYFLNSPRGKAAARGLIDGEWQLDQFTQIPIRLQPERPNLYTLYEQNFGLLTPILAETLDAAEKEFPVDWIEDAMRIAVIKNVRSWRYVDAILRSWKEKGRDGTDQRTAPEDRKRDSEGKFGDYIIH